MKISRYFSNSVVYLPWRLFASFFTYERNKSWRQIWSLAVFNVFLIHGKGLPMPDSLSNYEAWTTTTGLKPSVEELCNGAKLLWVGPKRLDKVLFYCHGGGYKLSLGEKQLSWLRYMQLELEKRGVNIGIAIVSYNLLPNAVFPSQLREATDGLQHLIAAGVLPENIIIGGDSAGGNLALQLLSHILYPLLSIEAPPVRSDAHFRGLLLVSPFVGAMEDAQMPLPLLAPRHERDFIPAEYHSSVCQDLLRDVPKDDIAYVDVLEAPEEWFKPLSKTVGRVLVTAGEWDFLREKGERFYERYLKPFHGDSRFVLEKGGIHVTPIFDFIAKEKRLSELTPLMIEWLADTMKES
ncbi:Alpha/Beta hydrolase protein [Desarmillaria tabescens]|uniref:Alpha/Beta hydrolase protein n=1 Tax=Armillaria tabescens TaxID=1929756 RepID=A0AA39JAV1_ARMTA|nr:Alpha/Beta hydrolase protein [Desarmillaria tabescens]KAK0439238.1 Alpha/Beta hydrolase protein [Desarmillaria tabescens]